MNQFIFRNKIATREIQWAALTPQILMALAIPLWLVALPQINLRRMNDLGLISALPMAYFAALIFLTLSFVLALRARRQRQKFYLAQIVLLIFILFGTTAVIEAFPRFVTAWTHLGFIEFISRTGETATWLDARFSWPIFFSLFAFISEVAGLENALPFLAWAHVYFNLLYIGPLLMIYRSLTDDERLVWSGLWLFFIANWIGQDYFSPQAFNYFLYLVILGVLLNWFTAVPTTSGGFLTTSRKVIGRILGAKAGRLNKCVDWLAPAPRLSVPTRPYQRAGLVLIIAILFAVVASSHQLTPFALLGGVTALVVFDRCTLRSLPVLMAVMIGSWISFMTVSFLSGHLSTLTGDVGQVSGVVSANVSSRFQGSPEHALALISKVVMALVVWGLAFLGGVRRLWNGRRDVTLALLAAVPFSLIALQSYGGEMMLRVYLFALPWMVFFVAALFYPRPESGRSWRATVALGLMSLALLGGFLIARYGNERMDYMTAGDVTAVRRLHQIAQPGSLLVAITSNLPWRFQNVDQFEYETGVVKSPSDIDALVELMADSAYEDSGAYLILTHSQQAQVELFLGWEPGKWERIEEALLASDKFHQIYQNNDARIFVLTEKGKESAQP